MLEKKEVLISRSLIMFRIRFCPTESFGKAFGRKSLFPHFFFVIIFKLLKSTGCVYKYETRVFCGAQTLQKLRGVWVRSTFSGHQPNGNDLIMADARSLALLLFKDFVDRCWLLNPCLSLSHLCAASEWLVCIKWHLANVFFLLLFKLFFKKVVLFSEAPVLMNASLWS